MIPSRLILFAHGSREAAWRAPFEKLMQDLATRLGLESVAIAYLDHCPPTLDEVADAAVQDGMKKLVVLPLFFSGGGHVSRDVPKVIADIALRCPELNIEIQPAIGEWPEFADMIAARLKHD